MPRSRRRMIALVLAAGALAAGALGASYAGGGAVFLLLRPPLDLSIDGIAAPAQGNPEAWLVRRGIAPKEWRVFTGETHEPVPGETLGFELDVDRTLARVRRATRERSWLGRLRRAFVPGPDRAEVEAAWTFSPDTARSWLESMAPSLHREAQDARLDIRAHRRHVEVPGRELDVEASLQRLELAAANSDVFELAFRAIPPRVTSEQLAAVDVSRVLASFETDFRKKAGRRAINIRRAADLLNGSVIPPGAVFSFNQVVGDRTERNGFTWAPVIVNDEMEPGLGGGVCQVASTVHAAAVLAGLEVKERRSHSRPSGYAPLGLDAAVIYGEVDLKLRNPYPAPLMVHAFLPSPFVIRVELLGAEPSVLIEHRYAVTERHDFYRRLVEDPSLEAGRFERTQEGGFGYDIISVVNSTGRDGATHTRRYSSKYYPVPEVYSIGPGTAPEALPALPDGATRVEIAGLSDGVETEEGAN